MTVVFALPMGNRAHRAGELGNADHAERGESLDRQGETVVDDLYRILTQGFGCSDAEVTGCLGIIDTDGSAGRAFAISTGKPDGICHDSQIPHRWIGSITVSDLVPGIAPVPRTQYAAEANCPVNGLEVRF